MHIPDNYDLYRKHEAEQEEWLSKRPICDCCKEFIQDEFLYKIDGVTLCEECMNDNYRQPVEE